ncbi:unnamed protein product [Periconia digitata]|uniref:EthD domain-containing protein n=1 Tax=Periconia digitata TaxID=1303443 RepID=A0A9W4USI6_9PLEO|nr:unnamed protein product [Periconia digitata]
MISFTQFVLLLLLRSKKHISSSMVYSILLLVTRKPGMSWPDFKHHWETQHVPLIKRFVGDDFPLSHTRHYFERNNDDKPNVTYGNPHGVDFDALAILTFSDRDHHARFSEKLSNQETHELHIADLEKFIDLGRFKQVMIEGTEATGRDGGMVGWRFVGSV